MTGNIALNVAIGLVFIYTLYSLLTTTVVEFIAVNLGLRSKNLKLALRRMLDDGDNKPVFSIQFNNTPVIKYLSSWKLSVLFRSNKYPSYMRAKSFSQAVVYLLRAETLTEASTADRIKETLKKYENTETGKYLLFLLDEAGNDVEKFRILLESWFEATMERSTGWYKKNLTYITLGFGLFVATVFNVDTFQMVKKLSIDPKAQEQYAIMAGQLLSNKTFTNSAPLLDTSFHNSLPGEISAFKKLDHGKIKSGKLNNDSIYYKITNSQYQLLQRMDTIYNKSENPQNILSFQRKGPFSWFYNSWNNFLGCLVTAIALSLGAPFWFDFLNKLMRLRGSVSIPVAKGKGEGEGKL